MTDDALWRAQAAARPGMCVYPPTRAVARSWSGVDDDQARRDALAGLGPPLPEEREQARLAMLRDADPREYARILGLPWNPSTRAASRPRLAEPDPAGIPPTTSPAQAAQTRWAARLSARLRRRKP